ncbi:MAG: sulfatase [Erysipelotrichaceae bacterium]|nr:sulfatase [Erysipelotrichaceae bacterium]
MRAIMVMFDTLTRGYLSNYGNKWVKTPNFQRLQNRCTRFDKFYGGSMPCIPARRDLQTGTYNFLHRSWGPLEPFDFSVVEELKSKGVYTHLCTDHSHYFEDGGATYHNRFNTWEGFRGQEGDRWTPQSYGQLPSNRSPRAKNGISAIQHYANITRMQKEQDMSSVQTFNAGLEFIEKHSGTDNWFLQIETFAPHEPFYVPQKYRDMYDQKGDVYFNWPAYGPIDSSDKSNQNDLVQLRKEYAALITMCDNYLGKVLDMMDNNSMWEDTMLIINTDHGFLLGEHDFLGKNFPPMYDEVIHTPFFLHLPGLSTKEYGHLAQTTDIAPTLLDFFGLDIPDCVTGKSLVKAVRENEPIHESILFGIHGGHVNITDGQYTFMKANVNEDNQPYVECTLMPTKMRGYFSLDELKSAKLVEGDRHSNGIPYLKYQTKTYMDSKQFGDLLFSNDDIFQQDNITDCLLREKYSKMLKNKMEIYDAPIEEFIRIGF